MKTCCKCSVEQSLDCFDPPRNECKKCRKAYVNDRRRRRIMGVPLEKSRRQIKLEAAQVLQDLGQRKCSKCKQEKEIEKFGTYRGRLRSYCDSCWTEYTHAWNTKNSRKRRETVRKYRYKISDAEFDLLHAAQGGMCAICKGPPIGHLTLSVDHCHDKGMVRGLLCQNCNLGLGSFKDSLESLQAAIVYLQKYLP